MANLQTRDLLSGSVPKQLIAFSLPFLAANVLQSVYAVVDMIIVGQFVGSAGLSGYPWAARSPACLPPQGWVWPWAAK